MIHDPHHLRHLRTDRGEASDLASLRTKGHWRTHCRTVCIAFALGFFALFSVPIFALTRAAGLPDGGAAAISVLLQVVTFIIVLVILVRIYGNAYAKSPPTQ